MLLSGTTRKPECATKGGKKKPTCIPQGSSGIRRVCNIFRQTPLPLLGEAPEAPAAVCLATVMAMDDRALWGVLDVPPSYYLNSSSERSFFPSHLLVVCQFTHMISTLEGERKCKHQTHPSVCSFE